MESIATPDNAHGKETYCHCENESIGRYVAFGSRTVLRRHHQEGPFLGVKPTKSGRKRKSSPECRLSGEERTSIGTSGTSLVSQKRSCRCHSNGMDSLVHGR